MSPSPPTSPTWSKYEDYLRREVHQLIAWGYEAARPLLNSGLEEEVITEHIVGAIQDVFNDIDSPEFVDNYNIKEENPVKEAGKSGKRRKRTDILIEHQMQGLRPRPWYIFESKRLSKPNRLTDKYCGYNGLERFVDGRYAKDFTEAGMLGYVQSDTMEFWEKELESYFRTGTKLSLQSPLQKVSVHPSLDNEWRSTHLRTAGSPIDIHHILLDCSDS